MRGVLIHEQQPQARGIGQNVGQGDLPEQRWARPGRFDPLDQPRLPGGGLIAVAVRDAVWIELASRSSGL